MGKVLNARDAGRQVPLDWGIDADGRPTTDPKRISTLLPLGGPKGSGLSFMIECLCSLTVGNPIIAQALESGGSLDSPFLNGVAIAIDLSAFGDVGAIRIEAERLGAAISALPAGECGAHLPSRRTRRQRPARTRTERHPDSVGNLVSVADGGGETWRWGSELTKARTHKFGCVTSRS